MYTLYTLNTAAFSWIQENDSSVAIMYYGKYTCLDLKRWGWSLGSPSSWSSAPSTSSSLHHQCLKVQKNTVNFPHEKCPICKSKISLYRGRIVLFVLNAPSIEKEEDDINRVWLQELTRVGLKGYFLKNMLIHVYARNICSKNLVKKRQQIICLRIVQLSKKIGRVGGRTKWGGPVFCEVYPAYESSKLC